LMCHGHSVIARKDAGCSKGANCSFCHLCEALAVATRRDGGP